MIWYPGFKCIVRANTESEAHIHAIGTIMETLVEMINVVKDYNIELYKGINTLTRDIAMLNFTVIEQMAFQKNTRPTHPGVCDDAEKGLTCAMPL